ncbi:MAG TPA: hypothetical protein VGJ06_12935 [Candidatus Acidoferrum sp.]|jgi:hypothetical protein
MLKHARVLILVVATLTSLGVWSASAQDKPKPDDRALSATPLKVQIVFTEFEGDKKVKSLPYTMTFTAGSHRDAETAKLRVGSRIPVLSGKDGEFQYVDIGTNLDCRAEHLEDGRYGLKFSLERSWVQAEIHLGPDQPAGNTAAGAEFNQPVIGGYRTDSYLIARDGQTVETTVATDPLNGKQLKIELTLTAPK